MDTCKNCGNPNRDAYRCEVCGKNPYRLASEAGASQEPAAGWLEPRSKIEKKPHEFWKNVRFILWAPFDIFFGEIVMGFISGIAGLLSTRIGDEQLKSMERQRARELAAKSDHELLYDIAQSTGSPCKKR